MTWVFAIFLFLSSYTHIPLPWFYNLLLSSPSLPLPLCLSLPRSRSGAVCLSSKAWIPILGCNFAPTPDTTSL